MFSARVVDLSHRMRSGHENFKLETRTYDVTEELPNVTHRPDVWYVLSEITFSSHVGTHVEFPYHHWKEGADAADYPLSRLIGRASVLDFTHKHNHEMITLEEVQAYAGHIAAGDVILIRTGCDALFYTERWEEQPYLQPEALDWLIGHKPIVIGTDAAGFEVPGTDYQPNHLRMFQNDIAMIESATNLAAIQDGEYTVFVLPLAIEGIDACPVRLIAVNQGAW